MANKKAELLTYEVDDAFEVITDEEEKPQTKAQAKTNSFIEAMSGAHDAGEGHVKIMRILADGQGNEVIATYPMDKFESHDGLVEFIRIHWGGGEYRLQAKVPNDKGKIVIAGSEYIKIAKEKSTGLAAPSQFSEMSAFMADQQKMMRELLENRSPTKALDFDTLIDQFAMISMAAAPLITLFMANRSKQQDPIKQLSQMMLLTGQIKDLNATEEEDHEPGLMGLFGQFMETMQTLKPIPGTMPGTTPGTTPGNAQALPIDENAPVHNVMPENPAIPKNADPKYAPYAVFFNVLLPMAEKAPNTRETAENLVKSLKPEQKVLFEQLLSNPKVLSFLIAYDPAFGEHIDWINDFIIEFEIALHGEQNNEDLHEDDLSVHNPETSTDTINDADITETDTNENGATIE